MILNIKKIKFVLVFILCIFSYSASADSRLYSFNGMIEYSTFIGKIKIISKNKISNDNGFSCGYEYNFSTISSQKGSLNKQIFWSMSDELKVRKKYLIFLDSSSYIVDTRTNNSENRFGDKNNENILLSFQKCKPIIPKLGISADGSGYFYIGLRNNNKQYIYYNTQTFYNFNAKKLCTVKQQYHQNNLVNLECFQKFIISTLDDNQAELQKIYDGIIKNFR